MFTMTTREAIGNIKQLFSLWHCVIVLRNLSKVYKNPVRKVARAANFCAVARNTCWCPVLKLLNVTFLAPKLLENLWTPAVGYK
jgi:hypothetical protein